MKGDETREQNREVLKETYWKQYKDRSEESGVSSEDKQDVGEGESSFPYISYLKAR